MKKLGDKCKCCGESEIHKLTIDHINNDGSSRRAKGEKTSIGLLVSIDTGILDKNDFQILCWNCNYSKHIGKGKCVHTRNNSIGLTKLVHFDFNQINFTPFNNQEKVNLFFDSHYLKSGKSDGKFYAGLLDDLIVFMIKFVIPIRYGNGQLILELDRFHVNSRFCQKNLDKYCIENSIKILKKDNPGIKQLITFVDSRIQYLEDFFKSMNWENTGKVNRGYYYEDESGHEVSKIDLCELVKDSNLSNSVLADLGYKKIHSSPKFRFVYKM